MFSKLACKSFCLSNRGAFFLIGKLVRYHIQLGSLYVLQLEEREGGPLVLTPSGCVKIQCGWSSYGKARRELEGCSIMMVRICLCFPKE